MVPTLSKTLPFTAEVPLPLSAVTSKLAFFGENESGKSYATTKLAELMWDAGAQFVAIDPTGIWWGLRTGEKSLPIAIFGGLHGDLEISSKDGALIAEVIVSEGISAVIDVSQFRREEEKCQFVADFMETLFFLKKANISAIHVFLEEAQEFAPEQPAKGQSAVMTDRIVQVVKLGRNFGIGVSFISQRPQDVSKRAVNLSVAIFAFRMTGSHEIDQMVRWFRQKPAFDGEILTTLETGKPFLWSPKLLDVKKVVSILEKRTGDVSKTVEVGVDAQTRTLSPIAVDALKAKLAEGQTALAVAIGASATAAAHSPSLAPNPWNEAAAAELVSTTAELDAIANGLSALQERERAANARLSALGQHIASELASIASEVQALETQGAALFDRQAKLLNRLRELKAKILASPAPDLHDKVASQPVSDQKPGAKNSRETGKISRAKRSTGEVPDSLTQSQCSALVAIGRFPNGILPRHLAAYLCVQSDTGFFRETVRVLRDRDLIEPGIRLVAKKRVEGQLPPRSLADVHRLWIKKTGGRSGELIIELLNAAGNRLSIEAIGTLFGIKPDTSYFRDIRRDLASKGITREYREGGVRYVALTDFLFPEGLQ